MIAKKVEKLLNFTNEYELFDLVKAVFCINICINNRSGLESSLALNAAIVDYISTNNKRISTYSEFCNFFERVEPILQVGLMDDYIVEDFGNVVIRYQEKIYNVIIGTGHNQVFGLLHYLPYLADMTNHENEERLRWDRLQILHITLMAFLNTFGYDFQYTSLDEINRITSISRKSRLLNNFSKLVCRMKLDNQSELKNILKTVMLSKG